MVQICGRFKLIKNENYKEHLIAIGFTEAESKFLSGEQIFINVTHEGKKIVIREECNTPITHKWVLDEEVDDYIGNTKVKSIASLDADVLVVRSQCDDEIINEIIFHFSDNDVVVTYKYISPNESAATRHYKRML